MIKKIYEKKTPNYCLLNSVQQWPILWKRDFSVSLLMNSFQRDKKKFMRNQLQQTL